MGSRITSTRSRRSSACCGERGAGTMFSACCLTIAAPPAYHVLWAAYSTPWTSLPCRPVRRLAQTGGLESETSYIWQHPRRGLDRGARLQQHRRRIPRTPDELVPRPVGDRRLDRAAAELHLLLLDIDRHRGLRRAADLALQPLQILLRGAQARDAEHRAVTEEDLPERPTNDDGDTPAHQRLRRVLARGSATEVLADHEHRGALVRGRVERMLRVLLFRVLEGVLAHRRERHFLEKARRDDAVRIDVVAGQGDAATDDLTALEVDGAHFRISLTSATAPVIAAAATMAGLIKSVRPVGLPWRPMKLRLLEEALISRPTSWSGFMPRHIEQPALRHSKPAAWKISGRPSASAALATC